MTELELKACPYCRRKPAIWKHERCDGFVCQCEYLSFHTGRYKYPEKGRIAMPICCSRDAAIMMWNKYVEERRKRITYLKDREKRTCSCGRVYPKKSRYCPSCGAKVER